MAVLRSDGLYDLFGYKWFSSATDADMTLTLARPVANDNEQPVQVNVYRANEFNRLITR